MIDCDAVRRRMDAGEPEPMIEEHLRQCAGCRAEVEFGRRVAAAVAAMPRVRAPRALAGRVMAELRPAARPTSRLPLLGLRPWEIGWLGAACMLLMALAWIFAPWRSWGTAWGPVDLPGRMTDLQVVTGIDSLLRSVGITLAAGLGRLGVSTRSWPGSATAWACSAAGFTLALFALLSWHERASARPDWEEAHG